MKPIALALVVLLVLAFSANKQEQTAAVVVCGEVHGGGTATARGVDWAEDFGNWIHGLATTPIDSSAVKAAVEGVEKVLWYWARAGFLASKGLKLDPQITQLQQQAADARAAAEAQCTPCPQALPQDSSPLASLGAAPVTGSPEEVVRQVAARYWPADQVETAVAVAGAESTFRPTARLAYGGAHMDGLWQINDRAHADLIAGKQWQDPSVNAYMAHQIWLDAGKSWSPWSTYSSGSYRKFLKPSVADNLTAAVAGGQTSGTFTPDATSAAPAPTNPQNVGCQSSGMPAARIATWNSNHGPTDGRVVNGMVAIAKQADVIGTQELSSSVRKRAVLSALKPLGWDVVGDQTSHPIYFDTAKFALVSHTEQLVYTRGDPIEGMDQGTRYVVTAVLRSVVDGKTLTVVNYHQLPHIQSHGGWNPHQPKRRAVAEQITATAMTSARTHMSQGAVVVTADANWDGDPNGAYRAAGLSMASQVFGSVNTLRGREIDQVLFSAGAPAAERELGRYGSDHTSRVVDFPASQTQDAAPVDGVTPADFNFPGQNTVDQALAYMQNQQSSTAWGSRCLAVVGRAYGNTSTQPVGGHFYAVGQWDAMPAKYKHADGSVPPRGALIFWRTGSPAGHIAISAGGGYVWTSDPPGGRRGSVGKVPIAKLDAWGPRIGWSAPYFIGRTGGSAA